MDAAINAVEYNLTTVILNKLGEFIEPVTGVPAMAVSDTIEALGNERDNFQERADEQATRIDDLSAEIERLREELKSLREELKTRQRASKVEENWWRLSRGEEDHNGVVVRRTAKNILLVFEGHERPIGLSVSRSVFPAEDLRAAVLREGENLRRHVHRKKVVEKEATS